MGVATKVNRWLSRFGFRIARARSLREEVLRRDVLLHSFSGASPRFELDRPEFTVGDEDLQIAERVVAAWRAAREAAAVLDSGDRVAADRWTEIGSDNHAGFLERLLAGDVRGVAEILVNGLHHPVTRGLCWDGRDGLTFEVSASPEGGRLLGMLIADRMFGFAEALGVAPVELPEFGCRGDYGPARLQAVVEALEQACGATLAIPGCFGLFGLKVGSRTIGTMTPSHGYTAWRIDEVLGGSAGMAVCEIGGGYGGCAYFAMQRPIARYTIIDLPVINALQGYFLCRTCGPDRVRLFGEPDRGQTAVVLPNWCLAEQPDRSFDLVLNQESLTEIDRATATDYVAQVRRTTRRWFLSINHETGAHDLRRSFRPNVVAELVDHDGGFVRRRRHPTWIRRGHVEELFELARDPADREPPRG